MNKKELVAAVSDALRQNDIKKQIKTKSEIFRVIQDETGDEAVFTIDRKDRRVMYSLDDIQNILDMTIDVIVDTIRRGESINVRGLGTLTTVRVAARRTKEPEADIWHDIPAMTRPKFRPGFQLAAAARASGLQEDELGAEQYLPLPEEDPEDD